MHAPTTCPYGHPLGPGRVLVGWKPCGCDGARDAGGHRTYSCNACRELSDRRETLCYFPPHRMIHDAT
ncbi:hypothetical protein GCM10027589_51530 [Actinocorallia lasiicapitis]